MRHDLFVFFQEKDEVRRLGARWDPARKVWYIENLDDLTPFLPYLKHRHLLEPTRTSAQPARKTQKRKRSEKNQQQRPRLSPPAMKTQGQERLAEGSRDPERHTELAPWEHHEPTSHHCTEDEANSSSGGTTRSEPKAST